MFNGKALGNGLMTSGNYEEEDLMQLYMHESEYQY